MGMDVHGKHPTSTAGKYFCNNMWWWHPLWDYCVHVAPDIAGKVKYGHSNDGDGLGARDSRKLAERLRAEIDSGRTAAYATAREQAIACNGNGKHRPFATDCEFDVENVRKFAAFLADCGGFRIW